MQLAMRARLLWLGSAPWTRRRHPRPAGEVAGHGGSVAVAAAVGADFQGTGASYLA